MRTTVTLDDDVAAQLKALARERGIAPLNKRPSASSIREVAGILVEARRATRTPYHWTEARVEPVAESVLGIGARVPQPGSAGDGESTPGASGGVRAQ